VLILVIYIMTCVSCTVFYLRERRHEFNAVLHLVVPVARALVFLPVLLAGLGIDFGGLGIEPLGYPATIALWVIDAWLGQGFIVLGYFLATDRSRIAQTRLLFTAGTSEPETSRAGAQARR
jgi:hypothetical protein